MYQVRDLSL